MARPSGFLDGFRQEMQQEGADQLDGETIARRLHEHLVADGDRLKAPIADMIQWAMNVEIELNSGAMWTVECLGADAYHFYPAHIGEDGSVVWMNVWVANDLTLEETIERVGTEVFGEQDDDGRRGLKQ
jgi:hypothetical protein